MVAAEVKEILDSIISLHEESSAETDYICVNSLSNRGISETQSQDILTRIAVSLDDLAHQARRRSNAFSPLNRLPEEILFQILVSVRVEAVHGLPAETLNSFKLNQHMTSTCHWWRDCALRRTSLWSRIVIGQTTDLKSVEVLFERSMDAPLTFRIDFERLFHPSHIDPQYIRKAIKQHASRCETLNIVGRITQKFLPLRGKFKNLKRLSLNGLEQEVNLFDVEEYPDAPSLVHISISDVNSRRELLPGHKDTLLESLDLQKLVSLHAFRADNVVLHCLHYAPNLTKVHWIKDQEFMPLHPTSLVIPPNVRSLSTNMETLAWLVQIHSLPSLTDLTLSLHGREPALWDPFLIDNLNEEKLVNLRSLHIIILHRSHYQVANEVVQKALASLPNLNGLRTRDWGAHSVRSLTGWIQEDANVRARDVTDEQRPPLQAVIDSVQESYSFGTFGIHLNELEKAIRQSSTPSPSTFFQVQVYLGLKRIKHPYFDGLDRRIFRFRGEWCEEDLAEGLRLSRWEDC